MSNKKCSDEFEKEFNSSYGVLKNILKEKLPKSINNLNNKKFINSFFKKYKMFLTSEVYKSYGVIDVIKNQNKFMESKIKSFIINASYSGCKREDLIDAYKERYLNHFINLYKYKKSFVDIYSLDLVNGGNIINFNSEYLNGYIMDDLLYKIKNSIQYIKYSDFPIAEGENTELNNFKKSLSDVEAIASNIILGSIAPTIYNYYNKTLKKNLNTENVMYDYLLSLKYLNTIIFKETEGNCFLSNYNSSTSIHNKMYSIAIRFNNNDINEINKKVMVVNQKDYRFGEYNDTNLIYHSSLNNFKMDFVKRHPQYEKVIKLNNRIAHEKIGKYLNINNYTSEPMNHMKKIKQYKTDNGFIKSVGEVVSDSKSLVYFKDSIFNNIERSNTNVKALYNNIKLNKYIFTNNNIFNKLYKSYYYSGDSIRDYFNKAFIKNKYDYKSFKLLCLSIDNNYANSFNMNNMFSYIPLTLNIKVPEFKTLLGITFYDKKDTNFENYKYHLNIFNLKQYPSHGSESPHNNNKYFVNSVAINETTSDIFINMDLLKDDENNNNTGFLSALNVLNVIFLNNENLNITHLRNNEYIVDEAKRYTIDGSTYNITFNLGNIVLYKNINTINF